MKMKKLRSFFSILSFFQLDFQWNFWWKFRNFSISNFLVDRFQNGTTFLVINRFGRDFFQSCVDFQGGEDGIEIRAIWSVWMPLQKNCGLAKKNRQMRPSIFYIYNILGSPSWLGPSAKRVLSVLSWCIRILEYTRGGRWRPACFLNLLIGRSGIVSSGRGGVSDISVLRTII